MVTSLTEAQSKDEEPGKVKTVLAQSEPAMPLPYSPIEEKAAELNSPARGPISSKSPESLHLKHEEPPAEYDSTSAKSYAPNAEPSLSKSASPNVKKSPQRKPRVSRTALRPLIC